MRKIIATGLAAATLLGSLSVGSAASAQYRHYYHRDRDHAGAAVAAGIAGLAVGAAIGSHRHRYYNDDYYYDEPYGSYYYGSRCRTYTVWDPYAYAYVERTRCY